MAKVTRVTDRTEGVCDLGLDCCPHSRKGTNNTGSNDVFINNLKAHRLTDTGPTNCPHSGTFESIEGSPDIFVNDLRLTRIADSTKCIKCGKLGQHTTGSDNVFAN